VAAELEHVEGGARAHTWVAATAVAEGGWQVERERRWEARIYLWDLAFSFNRINGL
jgi:hypothetical protein